MVHPSLAGNNAEDVENSEGESESVDSPEVAEDSENDEKQKEKGTLRCYIYIFLRFFLLLTIEQKFN
uniref:CTNNB1 binding N-teminal domain-containing protein n=1 Tax=Ascaris lumbricoides TaxID=6252 RepID=A0A0M3HKU6_ASCLU